MRPERYDIVLVVEYFRSVTSYLSIIKGLRSDFSIGVYQVPVCSFDAGKNNKAQGDFLELCQRLGADLVRPGLVKTSVLLIPQRPLRKDVIVDIQKKFDAESVVLLLGFAYPGIKMQDEIFQHFKFKKTYAIDENLIKFLANKRCANEIYDALNIVEVGLPFGKYPIIDSFNVDYILAMPTQFSFPYESDKWLFLEAVQELLMHIDVDDTIVHKPHNSAEHDQFSSKNMRILLRVLENIPGFKTFLKIAINRSPSRKVRFFTGKLYTAYLYEKILARTITMDKAGGSSHLAMEAFLPGVRKGVIGGTSNTMWGTLFFNLKFYNCVDIFNQKMDGENKLYGSKDRDKYLGLNLQYFMIPYCNGRLLFDEKLWNIPSVGCRNGDLIVELRKDIESSSCSGSGIFKN